ncbi:THAP domain-containing protein 5 [Armadillidium vulgare]|nr:THAP domain-containing protein 5 [Armadillidium vulgare]
MQYFICVHSCDNLIDETEMKRWKFYPCKFSKICSDHFTPDCINPGVGFGKPTLKQNAIPTIFNF